MSSQDLSYDNLSIDLIPLNVVIYHKQNNAFIIANANTALLKSECVDKNELLGRVLKFPFSNAYDEALFKVMQRVSTKGTAEEFNFCDSYTGVIKTNNVSKLSDNSVMVLSKDVSKSVQCTSDAIQKRQLEEVQKITHLGSWRRDINTNVLTWSDEVYRIFGEIPQSFVATYERYLSYLSKEDQMALAKVITKAIDENEEYVFEYKVNRNDGSVRYIREFGQIQYDENGVAEAIFGVVLDITDKKELQSLGYIVDNSMNEVYIFDPKTLKFTYVNKEAQRNTGYSLQEMKGMSPVDLKPLYTMEDFSLLLNQLYTGSREYLIFETIHERKDATRYNVEIRLQLMNIYNSKQFVVMAHDITERKQIEFKLQESEEKFRKISENTLIGVFIYQDNKYVYVNEALQSMTGYSAEEFYGMTPWEIMATENKETAKQTVQRRLKGEEFPGEYNDVVIITKNNQHRTMRVSTQTITYNNRFAGMGTLVDVTDLKETKEQLSLLAKAVEQMDEMVCITDKNSVISYVNDSFVAHCGYKKIELLGEKIGQFKSGLNEKSFYEELWKTILAGNIFKGVFINRHKDGRIYYEEETITPIMDEEQNIKNFVATSQDITKRVQVEEKLQKLATIDSLTGIYNRYKINKELDVEIARAKRYRGSFGLAMFDIDHFKLVNDLHGHDVGDHVLKELSDTLSKYIRESDRFGRWGGEEFMIILPHIDKKHLIAFVEKLREVISSHNFGEIDQITISVGITVLGEDDEKKTILKRVDDALYQAKKEGRNRVVFR